MTTTLDLMQSPRITTGKDDEGRTFIRYAMNGWGADLVATYWQQEPPADLPPSVSFDAWRYSLPQIDGKGGTFSHPTETGCKIMILRHLIDNGYFQPAPDNGHLDDRNKAIAEDIRKAWEARTGRPRVGDFVIMPNGAIERCAHGWDDGMQTCMGGSFHILGSGNASMSGSLNGAQLWEYFTPTEETKPGRFWFFSHNIAGAGRGVDLYLPCRVYKLEPFTMTEEEARAHPKAKASAAFWGENHRDHLACVASLMNPRSLA
jgi:hypothetical protein